SIFFQQQTDFLSRSDYGIRFIQYKVRKFLDSFLSHSLAGREIVSVIFINGMISMDDGNVQILCDPMSHRKSAEFSLCMNDVRFPFDDFLNLRAGKRT